MEPGTPFLGQASWYYGVSYGTRTSLFRSGWLVSSVSYDCLCLTTPRSQTFAAMFSFLLQWWGFEPRSLDLHKKYCYTLSRLWSPDYFKNRVDVDFVPSYLTPILRCFHLQDKLMQLYPCCFHPRRRGKKKRAFLEAQMPSSLCFLSQILVTCH